MKSKLLIAAIIATGLTLAHSGANHLYGQTSKSNMDMKDTSMKYSCPHHPDVISNKPRKCACGMELVEMKGKGKMSGNSKMKEETMKYTCPHHPDVISDKPGKCACGMELVAKESKDMMMKDSKMKKTHAHASR